MPVKIESLYWDVYAETRRFVSGMTGATTVLSRFAGFLTTTTGLVTALGVTMGIVGGKALAMAAAMDQSMRSIGTVIDNTSARLGELQRQIIAMSTRSPETPLMLSRSLYEIVQAGVLDTADAMKVLEASMKFATAGMTDTATSADMLTGIMNAYRMEATEATHVTDVMFQTVRLGKVLPEQLARSMGNVTTSAALGKVSIEELGAAIATLTLFNLSAEESTLSLNRLILSIIQPSRQTARAAREMGIEWNAAALQAKGFSGFMQEIQEKTGGNIVALQRLMPNIRSARSGFILASQGADEFQRILTEMMHAEGSVDRAFTTMTGSLDAQWKMLKNKVNAEFIALGTRILPPVVELLTTLNHLLASDEDNLVQTLHQLGVEAGKVDELTRHIEMRKLGEELTGLRTQLQHSIDPRQFPNSQVPSFLSDPEQMRAQLRLITDQATQALEQRDQAELAILDHQQKRKELSDHDLFVQQSIFNSRTREIGVLEIQRRSIQNILTLSDQIAEKQGLLDLLRGGEAGGHRFGPGPTGGEPPPPDPAAEARLNRQRQLRDEMIRSMVSTFGLAADMTKLSIDNMERDIRKAFGTIPAEFIPMLQALRVAADDAYDTELLQRRITLEEQELQLADIMLQNSNIANQDAEAGTELLRSQMILRQQQLASLRQERTALGNNASAVALLEDRIRQLELEIARYQLQINGSTEGVQDSIRVHREWLEQQDDVIEMNHIAAASEVDNSTVIDRQIALRQMLIDQLEDERQQHLDNAAAVRLYADEIKKLRGEILRLITTAGTKSAQEEKKDETERIRNLREKARLVKEQVDGGVKLAKAMGLIDSKTAALIDDLGDLGQFIPRLLGGDMTAMLPSIGALASALSGVFGTSPEERAARERENKARQENTEAIDILTRAVGDFGLDITGTQFSGVSQAIANTFAGRNGSLLRPNLAELGLSMKDLEAVAEALGITFTGTWESLKQLDEAMKAAELTQFATTFTGQLEALRNEFELFDITDPIEQLERLRDLAGDSKFGSPALAGALAGLDLNTIAGRDAALVAIQELFRKLQAGTLTPEELGGLTPQQFLDFLMEFKKTLETGGVTGSTQDASRSVQITEMQADTLLAYQSTQTVLQGRMVELLEALAMGGVTATSPLGIIPPDIPAGGAMGSVVIGEINVSVSGFGGDAAAAGKAAGAAAAREISVQLAYRNRDQARLQGAN